MGSGGGGDNSASMAMMMAEMERQRQEDRRYYDMQEEMRMKQFQMQEEMRMAFEERMRVTQKKVEMEEMRMAREEAQDVTDITDQIAIDEDVENQGGIELDWSSMFDRLDNYYGRPE
tara:strand:+ start:1477 stop:1827 length:351 start_codon:yes stop_codon:yes gene_type:complete